MRLGALMPLSTTYLWVALPEMPSSSMTTLGREEYLGPAP
jgi:hypothetical protein